MEAVELLLLSVGLAMDAFSVSIANAMADPAMSPRRKNVIAGTERVCKSRLTLAVVQAIPETIVYCHLNMFCPF